MDPKDALNKAVDPIAVSGPGLNLRDDPDPDSLRGGLDAAGGTGGVLAGALLTDVERQFMVDTIIDESTMLKDARKYTMNRPIVEIPRMTLGTKILQAHRAGGHPESREGDDVKPSWDSIQLISSKLVLPWSITEEFLEDNPLGGAAEQAIARMMGQQVANDLEDLAINGDERLVNDRLYQANDGYLRLAERMGSPSVDFAAGGEAAPFEMGMLDQIGRLLDTKFRRDNRRLRFYVSPNTWSDFVQAMASRQGNMADQYLTGLMGDPTFAGVPLRQVVHMPDGVIMLTNPENLIFAVHREMRLRKSSEGMNAIRRDERYYTMSMRCDFMIQDAEALVVARGIGPREA